MSDLLTIGVVLTLMDKLSGPLTGATAKIDAAARKITELSTLTAGAGQVLLQSMKSPVAAFAAAEDAAVRLQTVMMGSTGAVDALYEPINRLATELGNQLPGTTADFMAMMTVLKEQGASSTAILEGLGRSAAYLGVALKMPFEEAARFSARLSEAAGVAERDMMSFLDVIARTRNLGVATDEMGFAFGRSAGKLKEMGIQGLESAKTLAPLFALLVKGGLSGETVGTGFAAILSNIQAFTYGLTKSAIGAKDQLADLGVSLNFLDQKGQLVGVETLVQELEKLKTLAPEVRAEVLKGLFGSGQDAQMVATIIDQGLAGYQQVVGRLEAQADLNKKVTAQLGTLTNMWDAATGTFTNLLATFAGAAEGDIKAVIEWLGQLTEKMIAFTAAHPQLMRMIAGFALFGGVALSALGGLGIMLGGVIKFLSLAAAAVAALASPIGLVVAAVAAAAAAIYIYWEPIKAFFSGLWDSLTGGAEGLVPRLSAAMTAAVSGLMASWSAVQSFFSGFWDGLMAGLEPVLPQLQAGFLAIGTALQSFGALAQTVFGAIGALIAPVISWLQQLLPPIDNASAGARSLGEAFGAAVATAIGAIANLVSAVANLASQFYQAGLSAAQGLANGIIAGVKAVWAAAQALASQAVNAVTGALGIKSPSRVLMSLGLRTAEGFGLGITQGISGVAKQMGQMMTAVKTAVVPAALLAAGALAGQPALAEWPARRMPAITAPQPMAPLARKLAQPIPAVRALAQHEPELPRPRRPRPTPAPSGGAGQAPQFTLNLTVNGPADPQALATQIRQELDRWWRRQQAAEGLRREARIFD